MTKLLRFFGSQGNMLKSLGSQGEIAWPSEEKLLCAGSKVRCSAGPGALYLKVGDIEPGVCLREASPGVTTLTEGIAVN